MESIRELFNDAIRIFIDRVIAVCAICFRIAHFWRAKIYRRVQSRLRDRYGLKENTPVHSYDRFIRDSVESRFSRLGSTRVWASTSGSTRDPKRIAYDRKRLRQTRLVFVDTIFRYLALLPKRRSLFLFSSIENENSLTSLLLQESGLPPYVSGLQAPHRVQNHPAIRDAARAYGETAVRFWILAIANPGLLYATNPSTIALFLHEVHDDWERARALIADYVNQPRLFSALRSIHKRIASRGCRERLKRIAESPDALPVRMLFPDLQGYCCWAGGYVGPFLQQIRRYLPESEVRHFPMYSMSTETIETVPVVRNNRLSFLPMAPGVHYEFLEEGREDAASALIQPRDLIAGSCYTMVVSDAYGLKRYQTEDLFECVSMISGIPDLRFRRRRNLSYSFTGEKLTAEQLGLAYREVESSFPQLRASGFLTCFPSRPDGKTLPHYKLILVQTSGKGLRDSESIVSRVEQRLGEFNREFKAKMDSRRLGPLSFESIPIRNFMRRLDPAERSGPGSQFKFLPLYPKLWEASQSS